MISWPHSFIGLSRTWKDFTEIVQALLFQSL